METIRNVLAGGLLAVIVVMALGMGLVIAAVAAVIGSLLFAAVWLQSPRSPDGATVRPATPDLSAGADHP